jgi:hypothetical protein
MSDDSSPSSPARIRDPLLSRSNDDDDDDAGAGAAAAAAPADLDGSVNDASNQNDESPETSRHRQDGRRRRKRKSKKKRNPGLVKKLAFITHLLKTLDLVVFAELSALYYMEYVNSFVPRYRHFGLTISSFQMLYVSLRSTLDPSVHVSYAERRVMAFSHARNSTSRSYCHYTQHHLYALAFIGLASRGS